MSTPTPPTPLTPQLASTLLQQFLNNLEPNSLPTQLKLRFPLQPLLPLPIPFLHTSILFLLKTRFPLLIDFPQQERLLTYDLKIKEIYQQQFLNPKLKSSLNFDYFLILTIKLCIQFLSQTFPDLLIHSDIQSQLYSILVKTLIGLNMSQHSYKLLQKKFIDTEKYETPLNLPELNQITQTKHTINATKRTITMNRIQLKLRRRKLKNKRLTDRLSINMSNNKEQISLSKFKQDLQNTLRVAPVKSIKRKKLFVQLENNRCLTDKDLPDKQELKQFQKRSHQLQTEQISSSLKIQLLLKNIQHSYSRKNIVLRHSNSSPQHHSYLTITQNNQTKSKPNFQPRNSFNLSSTTIQKQTVNYWNSIKTQLKNNNQSFQF